MLDLQLPDLTFPDVAYGVRETPRDLRCLLYRGGAGANARKVGAMIDAGKLGIPLVERIELVKKIHEVIANFLGRGGRRATVEGRIDSLRKFFHWADETGNPLDLESVADNYLHWTDALQQRVRVGKGLSERSAHYSGSVVGWVLDRVIGRSKPIVKLTHLRKQPRGTRAVGAEADKRNLSDIFAFGRVLLDISDGLSIGAIWGPLPVLIPLRNGKVLNEWSRLKRPETLKPPNPKKLWQAKYNAKQSVKTRADYEADRTLRTRYPLVNLRIEAEMHMFMGQPAVNLAQVHQLRMDQWKFKPSTHGYEVRAYKHRRWGPVVFEIYSEYRKLFEAYLKWRKAIFPHDDDGLLFPLVGDGRSPEKRPTFELLKTRCLRAGIKYMPPSMLRNTNVNWMLRRTNDPDLTAEEKQHSTKTLIGIYEKPSQQRAMVQIKGYWAKHDPAQVAAGPGSCIGKEPEPMHDIPATATKPDCQTPAGCLFCVNQRDIDSLDHVWSLASYRLLKSFELTAHRQPASNKPQPTHPAELAIDRLTAKLAYIRSSSAKRETWVQEALLRIEEGRYHQDWAGMIDKERAGSTRNEA
ncbi:MAG: site-specific integrase [Gammaproteobacteria bacterium]|nr:site-specific integrase [Gammaproteobacteria bacterium]